MRVKNSETNTTVASKSISQVNYSRFMISQNNLGKRSKSGVLNF